MNFLTLTWLSIIFAISALAFPEDIRNSSKKRNRNLVKDLEANEKDEMSEFALNTLNSLDASYSKRILCRVLDGKKQISSGIVYKLKLSLVVVSDDRFNSNDKNLSSLCDNDEDRVVCEVDLLRSYAATDYAPVNVQVVKSECSDDHDGSMQKREISKRMAGGAEKVDPNSDYIKTIADKLIAKLDAESGASCKRKVNQILQASTQVVAGSLHHLKLEICPNNCAEITECKTCSAKVWIKEWMDFFEVTEFNCEEKSNIVKSPLTAEQLQFHSFIQRYNKQYENEEEKERRYRIFRGNLKKIQMLNEGEEGTAEYGVNEFADLSKSEFSKYYLGLKPNGDYIKKEAIIPTVQLPPDYDWRTYNAVTAVKNQGMCGSCWAFSVTGNVEGQYAVKHKQLVSLSEQELVDCDKDDNGCGGGYMTTAYRAIEKIGGLEQEKDYPYEGSNDKCAFNRSEVAVKVVDSVNITSDETKMAQWLYKNGPISIALNAFAMQFYIRGVSKPWKFLCNPNDLDHGVLIVGYGQYKKLPYWTIKNSWGRHWGESGYYRLYRGSGACGVNKMASSAIVD